jgi:hypothetical protein
MSSFDKYMAFRDRETYHLMFEQKLFEQGKLDLARRALARRVRIEAGRFERR